MNIYLAALYSSNFQKKGPLFLRLNDREKAARESVKYNLESYHYVFRNAPTQKIRNDGTKVFLDSGAFSAFTQGVDIDLPGYVDYIKRNMDIIRVEDGVVCASVLDGIGDPLKTYQNQLAMESLGVRPLPCFHYGEDERYLKWYMENYEYITLGGMVPITKPQLYHWLDRLWEEYLTDGSGVPKLKVHGFGLTTVDLVTRYPWHSVDSSSWVQSANTGSILIPGYGALAISSNSPTRKQAGRHYDSLTPELQAGVRKILETDQGYDVERLRVLYYSRWAYNCWSFGQMNEHQDTLAHTFFDEQISLFPDE